MRSTNESDFEILKNVPVVLQYYYYCITCARVHDKKRVECNGVCDAAFVHCGRDDMLCSGAEYGW